MFARIAAFELRYQLKNPVFWISAGIFFLLGFGLTASENVSIGTPGSVHENSPYAIANAVALLSLFYLFVITSFVANAVVRDDSTGFAPIIRSTATTRGQFLCGRFLGSFLIALLGYVAVPLGMGIGASMPWVDPETLGAGGMAAYLWPFLVIALPNILLSSAFLFMLATMTRSMLAAYIGVLVFVMGYLLVVGTFSNLPQYQEMVARFEPMAVGAIGEATRYWTAADMNNRLLPLGGLLLFNRLFVLALSGLFFAATWRTFSMTERAPSRRRLRKLARADRAQGKAAAVVPAIGGRTIEPTRGPQVIRAQLLLRLKTEILQVVKSPGLIVLLLLALLFTATTLWFSETLYGTPSYPLTANVITTVINGMGLFTIIIAVFYGGELVWRERDTRINEIVDSTATPGWVVFLPKIAAIYVVLLALAGAGMLAGVVYQLMTGAEQLAIGSYLAWYVFPQSIDLLLIAMLAVFLQVVSPNKYIGWGLMLVWFVSRIFLTNMGFTNMLYLYAAGPAEPLSDMNGAGQFWIGAMWARLYWLCFGVLLLLIAHLIWPRGTVVALRPRLAGMGNRLTLVSASVAVLAIAGMVGSGLVINRNINSLNMYRTADEVERQTAEYERRFLKYESLPRPVVTDVALDIDLFPEERRMEVKGRYDLRNETNGPIRQVHLRQGDVTVDFERMALSGADLTSHDQTHQYRIYTFDKPLMPGETAQLDFQSTTWRQGFQNGAPDTDLVQNGSFADNFTFAPIVGMDRRSLLSDRTQRRRQGLPDELRPAKLEDRTAQQRNYIGTDWVNSRITLSTAADQVPIAPGNRVSEVTRNGRRTATFVSPAPIHNFFSVQSADYALAEREHEGVRLTVYHDPDHAWNAPKMLDAMEASLDYYRENFGPYQFDYARIIEFPGYSSFAQAFAGTMPYSESIGFAADVRDPETIDYVSYVSAHELSHQYWAHQVVGGNLQGGTLTSETLAQYSALMVMKKLYGPDQIRRFLKYELDSYLGQRKGEVLEELPLVRVEDQGYIHYRKGSLVMYLLQERLGEASVNRALARFLARYRFKGAPYHRSTDLIAEFRKEARTPAQQALITDLFERITIYDLKASEATTSRNSNGSWTTIVNISAQKFYADGKGTEAAAPLAEAIEIGLFKQRPGDGAFAKSDVIGIRRRALRTGEQQVILTSREKPAFAGVDPYNYYIDRNSDDNLVAVD